MARIRMRRFPDAQFNNAGAHAPIPQSDITDIFGDGIILAIALLNSRNQVAAGNFTLRLGMDGDTLGSVTEISHGAPTIDFYGHTVFWIIPPQPGAHTFNVRAGIRTIGSFTLDAGNGHLTIIELPDWTDRPGAYVL